MRPFKTSSMYRLLVMAAVVLLSVTSISAVQQEWSPEHAARYLDDRLQQWFAWKPAMSPEGPCVSCHTGMTYLMARPALRRRLTEPQPTAYETGLLERLRANVGAKPESYLQAVEVIFAAFFLSERDAGKPMGADTRKAFDQLWALQLKDGASAGGWDWLIVDLDPWEQAESASYGAALAALAVGNAGREYASEPLVAPHVAALRTHLQASPPARRPLHDRLARLWASSKRPDWMSATERQALIDDVLGKQQPDGGWTSASLGPWAPHPKQPASRGSSSFATGYVAYVLQRAGMSPHDAPLVRALDWLAFRQDRETGAWPDMSMNKPYAAESMESLFMQDAATAFASLALLEAGR